MQQTLLKHLGVALPIVQAPMAGAQGSALTMAVAQASALGSLPGAMLSPQALCAELELLRQANLPAYNLNFFCHTTPPPNVTQDAAWAGALMPYYAECGLAPPAAPSGPGREPFSHALVDMVEPYRLPVVNFHFGLPAADLLARVRGWGSRIKSSASQVHRAASCPRRSPRSRRFFTTLGRRKIHLLPERRCGADNARTGSGMATRLNYALEINFGCAVFCSDNSTD